MNWYAIYTAPRAEKKAHAELVSKGIESYLPLQRTLRLWSDRKKWVEEPLFRSYLFVNIPQIQYFDVLNTPGVVRYITFEGKAVPVPEKQIEAIRYYLADANHPLAEANQPRAGANQPLAEARGKSAMAPGTMVEITRGPLRGLRGELIEVAGRYKVKVEIAAIGQSLQVTIPISQLKEVVER